MIARGGGLQELGSSKKAVREYGQKWGESGETDLVDFSGGR